MRKERSIYKNILLILIVLLFVAFNTSNTLFEHTHTIDGATITHSHFYGDNHKSSESGDHSEMEITLIASYVNAQWLEAIDNTPKVTIYLQRVYEECIYTEIEAKSKPNETVLLRGPPSLS